MFNGIQSGLRFENMSQMDNYKLKAQVDLQIN